MTDTSNIDRLLAVMARLRDPNGGCPWDLQQDFSTIAPYTIEEAYEVADAIERGDRNDLKDELGDLLLQVVFHARMAQEEGSFDFDAVAGAITDKMIRRHPHVFGTDGADTPDKVKASWEETKAAERAQKGQDDSALSGVARALPALIRAEKLSKRAARVGFTWSKKPWPAPTGNLRCGSAPLKRPSRPKENASRMCPWPSWTDTGTLPKGWRSNSGALRTSAQRTLLAAPNPLTAP